MVSSLGNGVYLRRGVSEAINGTVELGDERPEIDKGGWFLKTWWREVLSEVLPKFHDLSL